MRIVRQIGEKGAGLIFEGEPNSPDEYIGLRLRGDAFPRLIIYPAAGSGGIAKIVVGDGTVAPTTEIGAGGGGGGAPTDATYLTTTASSGLSNEVPVGVTPGGELGGTWAAPTVDTTHAEGSHSAFRDEAILAAFNLLGLHIAAVSGAHTASAINVADLDGHFDAGQAEAVLAEIGVYLDSLQTQVDAITTPDPSAPSIKDPLSGLTDRKGPAEAIAEGLVGNGVTNAVIEISWATLHTADSTYNWQSLDEQLAIAAAAGLKVRVRVEGGRNAPSWVKAIASFTLFPDDSSRIQQVPQWWDPTVKAKYAQFINAFGARYDDDERVSEIQYFAAATDFAECFQREQSSIAPFDDVWGFVSGAGINTTLTGTFTGVLDAGLAAALPTLPNASYPDGIPMRCEDEKFIVTTHAAGSTNITIGSRGIHGTTAATHAAGKRIGVEYSAQSLYLAGGAAGIYDAWLVDSGEIEFATGTYITRTHDHLTRGSHSAKEYRRGLASPYSAYGTMECELNADLAAVAPGTTGQSIAVTGKVGFPATGGPQEMLVWLEGEAILVTANLDTNTWTATRGVDGTTPTAHKKGTPFTMGRYVEHYLTTGNFTVSGDQKFKIGDWVVTSAGVDHGGQVFWVDPDVDGTNGALRVWWVPEMVEQAPGGGNIWRLPQWENEWEDWKENLAAHASALERTRTLIFGNPAQSIMTGPGTGSDPGVCVGSVDLDAHFRVFDRARLLLGARATLGNASYRFETDITDELNFYKGAGYKALYDGLKRRGPGGDLYVDGACIAQQTAATGRVRSVVQVIRHAFANAGSTDFELPRTYGQGNANPDFDSFASVDEARYYAGMVQARLGKGSPPFPDHQKPIRTIHGTVAFTGGSRANGTVTLTGLPAGHGYLPGDLITVDASDSSYDGTFVVRSVGATTVTYRQQSADDVSSGAGTLVENFLGHLCSAVTRFINSGAKTAALPSADVAPGLSYMVINGASAGNVTVTIHTGSGDAIVGTAVLSPGQIGVFQSDGANTWYRVS